MKGPFATLDEARKNAEPGELIVVRDTFRYRNEAWAVMANEEFTVHLNNHFSSWHCHWETA